MGGRRETFTDHPSRMQCSTIVLERYCRALVPLGRPLPIVRSDSTTWGFGDLVPTASPASEGLCSLPLRVLCHE
jgi:hypothetical protein